MIGSDTRNYKQDTGDNLYRRSMYTFWKRAAPPASMDILNAPTREVCTVRRERTDTPLQALVTLNDPQFIEAARFLAQTALEHGGDKPDVGVDFLARRVLCRPLRPEEATVVEGVAQRPAHLLQGPRRGGEEADRGGRVEGRPDHRPGDAGRLDHDDERADEFGRSVEQVRRAAGVSRLI